MINRYYSTETVVLCIYYFLLKLNEYLHIYIFTNDKSRNYQQYEGPFGEKIHTKVSTSALPAPQAEYPHPTLVACAL